MRITTKAMHMLGNIRFSTWIENFILLLITSLTFYSLLPVDTQLKTKSVIQITSYTSSSEKIIKQLNKNGYNVGFIDSVILNKMPKIKQGNITFDQPKLSRIDFLAKLTQAKIPLERITLIPGETKEIFFENIAQTLEINSSKLMKHYQELALYPEAGIAADTYLVPKKMNEKKLITFFLDSSERSYKKLAIENYNEYNTTQWHHILTIASIIQKEAANNKEMPLISSVIYNRLRKNMRLQMDGTLNYGKYSHTKVTPERIKSDTSSFNTYKHKGLPNSPIGSVSQNAIKAAIHPDNTDYLFFMRNKDGVHDFTNTFKKHRKNISKVKK